MSSSPAVLPREPFRAADLAALELTKQELRQLSIDGLVRRVTRGVYVDAATEDSLGLRLAAVRLAVTEAHVVVDRTAAWIHGVDTWTFEERDTLPPIEVCALRGKAPTRRGEFDGRTRDLGDMDIIELEGVRVTTPLRTALDLGCVLRRREAFAAMCLLAQHHDFDSRDLVTGVRRFRGRRGVIQARGLAPLVEPRVESPREAWTLLEILDAGLPPPVPQYWIEIDGVPTYRLDFAYPNRRICVEYDGFDHHLRTPEQREHDRRRRAWLADHGWTVIVVRSGDFTAGIRHRWLQDLETALAQQYHNRRW
ncbi:MAG: DUF559 domain-containing protein [Nocardioides sp.]|uniref:DUF559 domain-containing protein n=1 Tax=Nocardioides sp. TaxID=35761 RepID=UPI0039E34251